MTIATIISMSIPLLLGQTFSAPSHNQLRLCILFNDVPSDKRLNTGTGFSCIIQGMEKTILFDTGGNGDVLLSNMEKLKISPQQVDVVVLSHKHRDHTGGLRSFLSKHSQVTVYHLCSSPEDIKDDIKREDTKVVSVGESIKICKGVYSSGEIGTETKEHCLILKTRKGLVIVTGCAHPGIVAMVKHAKESLKHEIYAVLGGFHLKGCDEREVKEIIRKLKEMGVKKIAPSHCTGDHAIRLFRKAWGQDFFNGGCGAVIILPSGCS